jgi:hypothetical protein
MDTHKSLEQPPNVPFFQQSNMKDQVGEETIGIGPSRGSDRSSSRGIIVLFIFFLSPILRNPGVDFVALYFTPNKLKPWEPSLLELVLKVVPDR